MIADPSNTNPPNNSSVPPGIIPGFHCDVVAGKCQRCGYHFGDDYKPVRRCPAGSDPAPEVLPPPDVSCVHRGYPMRSEKCHGCAGRTTVYACSVHGECMRHRVASGVACCEICQDRKAPAV